MLQTTKINWRATTATSKRVTKLWVRENPIIAGEDGDNTFLVRFVDENDLYLIGLQLAERPEYQRYQLAGITVYSYPKKHDGSVQDAFLPGKAFIFLLELRW